MTFLKRDFTDIQQLIDQGALTDDEIMLLKRLTEEPTSVSADLLPLRTSISPKIATPIDLDVKEKFVPARKQAATQSLGLGFDPAAIEPESGFKPIVEGQGSSIPTLAFSVLDGVERPPVSPGLYEQDFIRKRQQVLDLLENRMNGDTYEVSVLLSSIYRALKSPSLVFSFRAATILLSTEE